MPFWDKKNKETSVADELPWKDLEADGTVLLKSNRLMKVWRVSWPDCLANQGMSDEVAGQASDFFHRHRDDRRDFGLDYWFVVRRVPSSVRPPKKVRFTPGLPPLLTEDKVSSPKDLYPMEGADADIEFERIQMMSTSGYGMMNICYAALAAPVTINPDGSFEELSLRKAQEAFASFEGFMMAVRAGVVALTTTAKRGIDNIMGFLKMMARSDEGMPESVRCPKDGFEGVDAFVSDAAVKMGRPLSFDDGRVDEKGEVKPTYVQTLSINNFPSVTFANCLAMLLQLPWAFTWTTHWAPFNNWESQKKAKKLKKEYDAGTKSWKSVVYEQTTGNISNDIEIQAAVDSSQMQDVLKDLASTGETIGELTSVMRFSGDTPGEVRTKAEDALKMLNACYYDAHYDTPWSLFPAWKSSIPGDLTSNRRRPCVTASNLADTIPFTNYYHGKNRNLFLERISGVSHAHAIGRLRTNELFYLNLNSGLNDNEDVGHTFIIGSTGGGKSVLLAFLASQWMRYPKSRVIYFDKDMSFANLCRKTGGAIYVPGSEAESLTFMPFSNIRENANDAVRWIEMVTYSAGVKPDPKIATDVQEICQGWDDNNPPTVKAFYRRLKSMNPKNAALPALEKLLGDTRLASLFSGEEDKLTIEAFPRKTMFEMGPLMDMNDPMAILPVLQFLFDRLDRLFNEDNPPTLLILDEAWKFLQHSFFRQRISEWLKTLRKKHVFVVMAMQNIGDIDNIEEFATSCRTVIYLPNEQVAEESGNKHIRELYSKMGVSDGEMNYIAHGYRKSEYFIKQESGSALVHFDITPSQIASLARDGV